MSNSPSLFERATAEIVGLHDFFVAWYDKATSAGADFGRFERAMGEDMHMIPPSGAMLDRTAVVDYVRANRGSHAGDFSIEIIDITPLWQRDDMIAVTYIEKQHRDGARTARRASALFIESSSAPHGVEWRHLHETWMQTVES